MRRRGGEKPRPANAPPNLRKVLTFSSPDAGVSACPLKDSASSITPAVNAIAVDEALDCLSPSVCETASESASISLAPSSPPESTLKSEISPAAGFLPFEVSGTASSAGASSTIVDSTPENSPAEGSLESAETDKSKSVPSSLFLAWACSTARSESADDLSRKIAAAVLNVIEEEAAAEAHRRTNGRMNLSFLLRVIISIHLVFLCAASAMVVFIRISDSGFARGPSPDFPPPT